MFDVESCFAALFSHLLSKPSVKGDIFSQDSLQPMLSSTGED